MNEHYARLSPIDMEIISKAEKSLQAPPARPWRW